jgi:hypothetical protein
MIFQNLLDASIVRLWMLYQFITSRRHKSIFAAVDSFHFNTTKLGIAGGKATITELLSNAVQNHADK